MLFAEFTLTCQKRGDQDTKCFPHPNSSWGRKKRIEKGFEEHMPKYQQ